jgi:transcription initiation factor TFIIE subunit alpha
MKNKNNARLTDQKIHEIVTEVVGEDAVEIVKFLKGKKDISEFKIAEKTKDEIQKIRNILYRLYNYNLVAYKRKKDRQKGWYISYWTFQPKKVKDLIERLKKEKLEHYKDRLEEEEANKNAFFICPKTCSRLDFTTATAHEFKCPECGALLQQQDNARTIDFLREKIREIEAAA